MPKQTPDHIAKRVTSRKLNGWFQSPNISERMSAGHKNGKQSARFGPSNPMWKGGLSKLRPGYRNSPEYKTWRDAVLERANYRCETCDSDKHVIAHHIVGWHTSPHLRLDLNNGQALCRRCHAIAEKLVDNLSNQPGPWPGRPSITTILCRYCGEPRYVPSKSANRYSTCGRTECVKRRVRDGLVNRNIRAGKNPHYKHGRYVRQDKVCPACNQAYYARPRQMLCKDCLHATENHHQLPSL